MDTRRFENAIAAFDQYHASDPNKGLLDGQLVPKELLYAKQMTEQLAKYHPNPSEDLMLAAHCQHIGRWEIERSQYPMDKKGYFQWRNKLKDHHAAIAADILKKCGYDDSTIDRVKLLLLKKELSDNLESQTLEDTVCFVFLQYYSDEFAAKHDDEKVIDILRKTMRKMSAKAIAYVATLSLSEKIKLLTHEAASSS